MSGAIERRLAKIESKIEGDQIPIFCEEEREVPATIDRMIAAGELSEADRPLCVYWLNCEGPNAMTHAKLIALLAQWEAEEKQHEVGAAPAAPGDADRCCDDETRRLNPNQRKPK
jgi:hypothetical protein